MIILSNITEVENLNVWIEENRPDKGESKPYFEWFETDLGCEVIENALIKKGLKALAVEYYIAKYINGVSVSISSKDLD